MNRMNQLIIILIIKKIGIHTKKSLSGFFHKLGITMQLRVHKRRSLRSNILTGTKIRWTTTLYKKSNYNQTLTTLELANAN